MNDLITKLKEAAEKATPGKWDPWVRNSVSQKDCEFIALANPENMLRLIRSYSVQKTALLYISDSMDNRNVVKTAHEASCLAARILSGEEK